MQCSKSALVTALKATDKESRTVDEESTGVGDGVFEAFVGYTTRFPCSSTNDHSGYVSGATSSTMPSADM